MKKMKSKMKSAMFAAGTLGTMMLTSSAFAQIVPGGTNGDGNHNYQMLMQTVGSSGAYINCQTGNCSFDVPYVIKQMMVQQLTAVSKETQDRYEGLLANTKDDLNDLVRVLFETTDGNPSLIQLSNSSLAGKDSAIDMQPLFQAYANYQAQYQKVENNFTIMADFFDGNDMSTPIGDQSIIAKFPTKTGATINPLVKTFWLNLRALNRKVCSLKFMINYPNGTTGGLGEENGQRGVHAFACDVDNTTATIDPSKTVMPEINIHYAGEQTDQATIQQLKNKLRAFRAPPQDVKDSVQKLGEMTRETIISFIKIFGIQQSTSARAWSIFDWKSWGGGKGGNGMAAANDLRIESEDSNYKTLIEFFWARSALRYTTGLPIGAFDINYDHKPNNSDVYQSETQIEALSNIPTAMIFAQKGDSGASQRTRAQADSVESARSNMSKKEAEQDRKNVTTLLQEASLKYLYALNTTKSRSTLIAGLDQTSTHDLQLEANYTSVIDLTNSFSELFKGGNKLEVAKVTNLVLQLMAADLFEEQMIRQQGGLKKMMALYKARYVKISPARRQIYQDLKKAYHNSIEQTSSVVDKDSDTQFQDEGTDIKSETSTVAQNLRTWLGNISQARVYQVQLDYALGAGQSKEIRRSDSRANDL